MTVYDIFISYSHTERPWVQDTLLPRLEQAGLTTCVDYRDFEYGVPSLVNIERAVDSSRHTLAVMTPAWLESAWTELESLLVGTADPAGRKRRLVPIMLQPCQPPARIAILTYADFTQPESHDAAFARLVAQLQRNSPPPKPPPTRQVPFIAGPPLTHPRQFFGRERELRRLFQLWQSPPLQNAAVVGPRGYPPKAGQEVVDPVI